MTSKDRDLSDPYVVEYYRREEQRKKVWRVVLIFAVAFVMCFLIMSMQSKEWHNGYDAGVNAAQEEPEKAEESSGIASDFLREKAQEQAEKIDEEYGPGAYGGTQWIEENAGK